MARINKPIIIIIMERELGKDSESVQFFCRETTLKMSQYPYKYGQDTYKKLSLRIVL